MATTTSVPIKEPVKEPVHVHHETEEEKHKKEEEKKRLEAKMELLKKIQAILAEFRHEESNIPISNNYWDLLNDFRTK